MGQLTYYERLDALEVIVRGLCVRIAVLDERVDVLKQPVIVEKVRYRNRVKPKPKKKPLLEGMRIRRRNEALADKDRVSGAGE